MVRDDIYEYSLDGHHTEEEGVKIRKKIWFVTALLSIITIVEVAVGIFFPKAKVLLISEGAWTAIKFGYIILTVIKAGYIVMVFMHLGDEKKGLKNMVIVPYTLFILYLIFICLMEATHVHTAWTTLH